MNSRSIAYLLLFALMGIGYACKNGGDDVSHLNIVETAPTDGQTEVPVETRIGFRIDASIDPATLSSETVFLTDDQGAQVPSTVFIGDEPDIAELRPDEPLAVITTFTVTVTTGLASTGGATLEEDFEWEFTTVDSEWGVSEWLEEIGTGTSDQPQVAVDGQSNALAVWKYTEPAATRIWAARYTRVDLWGAPEPIDDSDQASTSTNPRLATDDAGNGFVVWEQSEDGGATANIWTNRYAVDEGWGNPSLLQNGEVTAARVPSVAADPAGNATAVWVQREMDGDNQVVWASRYEPGSGWGAAASIDPMPTPTAGTKTSVGMDTDGNAIAVWARPTVPSTGGRGEVLWANRYVADEGWGTAELIKPDPDTRAREERLAVGPNGDAFVVWVQNEETRDDIWSVRYSGSTWGTPEPIDSFEDRNKKEPDIAVDAMGVAHAVWSQADPDFENIWANQYEPGSGWGAPELIEPPNEDPNEDGDATAPRLGINAAGNTFVVWRQIWEDWGSIWSNRLDPGTGWMTAERIEDEARAAKLPQVAVDENRHAHAVWLHSVDIGIDWVRTNRFE
jgi:hypothetical protein